MAEESTRKQCNSIAVGSTNPVKIDAVRLAFAAMWPEQSWKVQGISVPSGVSTQPMSDLECIHGARNRAKGALAVSDAAYGVGLEGGLQLIGEWWFDSGWIVVIDRNDQEGVGSTAKIIVPPQMIVMVHQGMEVGEAGDALFQQQNSKQAQGHFGLLTNNAITRTKAYTDGVLTALARFVYPQIF
jgi:inosine/xanthosine triphosphatase